MATKRKPFEPQPEPVVSGVEEAEGIERVLTVNGKPIPVEFAHAITYAMTDQGQEEARAADLKNGMKSSGVRAYLASAGGRSSGGDRSHRPHIPEGADEPFEAAP